MNFPGQMNLQYTTEKESRNSSRRNEEAESKRKRNSAMDMSGGESKVQSCEEQYCTGT